MINGIIWEDKPQGVIATYMKVIALYRVVPKYHRARETRWESGWTIIQG